jgi:hypothetical protein
MHLIGRQCPAIRGLNEIIQQTLGHGSVVENLPHAGGLRCFFDEVAQPFCR